MHAASPRRLASARPAGAPALVAVVLAALAGTQPATAADLDDQLGARWRGAWVVTRVPVASHCDGRRTDVDVAGGLAHGDGRFRFEPGELARVVAVDAKKAGRIEVGLELGEPWLEAYADGPFTLYRQLTCLVELRVDVSRDQIRARDVEALDRQLTGVLERHASLGEARASAAWNRRTCAAPPAGYEETLARHRSWTVRRDNEQLRRAIDQAVAEAAAVLRGVATDEEYARGLALGIDALRSVRLGGCDEIRTARLDRIAGRAAVPAGLADRAQRGFDDGRRLAAAVLLAREAPRCLLPGEEPWSP